MKQQEQQRIVTCVPVEHAKQMMPEFPACATYSLYEQVACPVCARPMWLGERGKVEVQTGRAIMLCMACVLLSGQTVDVIQSLQGNDQ